MRNFIFLLPIFVFFACQNKVEHSQTKATVKKEKAATVVRGKLSYEEQVKIIKEATSNDFVLSNDIHYINDFILKGKFKLDISNYELENAKNKCYPIRLSKKMLHEFYNEGFKNIGDVNGDGKADSVFVLHSLNYCEIDEDSYYFTNNRIPRIKTESNCCHPESIFSIGDIDEDGGNEIAEYYSSCTSNFKRFNIWTLKANKWKFIKSFGFVYNNGKYVVFKDFHKLHKKIAKNKFKFLAMPDITVDGVIMNWETVTMN